MNVIENRKVGLAYRIPPFCYLLPILLLTFVGDVDSFSIWICFYIIVAYYLNHQPRISQISAINHIFALPIDIFLAYRFFSCWTSSSIVKRLAGIVGLSNTSFLIIISTVLFISAYLGIASSLQHITNACRKAEHLIPNRNAAHDTDIFDVIVASIGGIIVGVFSAICPINNRLLGNDEAVFAYIGRRMAQDGLLPYKDLFDHKGIVLYFIEYIGAKISLKSLWGIWILCVINAIFTFLIVIKSIRLLTNRRATIYFVIFAIVSLMAVGLDRSLSLCEGFALPWIAISTYIFLSFLINNSYRNKDIFLLGISFAVVFWLRCNMVGPWVGFVLIVLIKFISDKKWKNIWQCLCLFSLGIIAVTLPIAVYFYLSGTWKDMIECYFMFNFEYIGHPSLLSKAKVALILVGKLLIPFSILYTVKRYWKDREYVCCLIVSVITVLSISISGNSFAHYAVVLLPMMGIVLTYFINDVSAMAGTLKMRRKEYIVISSLCFIALFCGFVLQNVSSKRYVQNDVVDYIQSQTKPEDDVLIVGNEVQYYLRTDRVTSNKYFYQSPIISYSEERKEDFLNQLKMNPSDYIIDPNSINTYAQKVVDEYINANDEYITINFDTWKVYKRIVE